MAVIRPLCPASTDTCRTFHMLSPLVEACRDFSADHTKHRLSSPPDAKSTVFEFVARASTSTVCVAKTTAVTLSPWLSKSAMRHSSNAGDDESP